MNATRAPNLMKFLAIAAVIAMIGACGGEGSYEPDPSQLAPDQVQPLSYPSGGSIYPKVGEVIADFTFASAVYDPGFLCKTSAEQNLDKAQGPQPLSLGQLFRGSQWCLDKPRTLAWFALTTGT